MKTIRYIIASMRIQQWIKNLFIFSALIFSGNLFYLTDIYLTVSGFILFSFISSGVYLLNDIVDIEKDKLHPIKSVRPLASGKLSPNIALVVAVLLIVLGISVSYLLQPYFALVLLIYLILNVWYSYQLKTFVILDVMTISAGFVLRVVGGAIIIGVPTSEWLIICTILLSLFLGFSKRRHELLILEQHANTHRPVLQHYSPYFLDQMIGIVTATTVMSYALYTISDETIHKFGTKNLIYTVPFVLYGIFRYLYLVHKKEGGGNPTKIMVTDPPLIVNVILWIVIAIIIIYRK
ncbi:MAG: decaprenyl-phosphate phosphoribosyltransferase [Ignavibacteriales bacterium]|nr:decaprenyl-phosphate phosphoribosyltransferase [Ignavibacteriales bacterium]